MQWNLYIYLQATIDVANDTIVNYYEVRSKIFWDRFDCLVGLFRSKLEPFNKTFLKSF